MQDYNASTDFVLLSLVKEGDELAFRAIYERYWAVLYQHALRMTGREDEAQDVVQELFMHVWEKASEITLHASLSSYLYKGVRNKILNLIEKNRVRKDYKRIYEASFHDFDCITDEVIRQNELKRLIEKEINKLPQKMQTVFKLSRDSHQSYKQIAERMSISERTVKKQISNAIKILRVKLGTFLSTVLLIFLS